MKNGSGDEQNLDKEEVPAEVLEKCCPHCWGTLVFLSGKTVKCPGCNLTYLVINLDGSYALQQIEGEKQG